MHSRSAAADILQTAAVAPAREWKEERTLSVAIAVTCVNDNVRIEGTADVAIMVYFLMVYFLMGFLRSAAFDANPCTLAHLEHNHTLLTPRDSLLTTRGSTQTHVSQALRADMEVCIQWCEYGGVNSVDIGTAVARSDVYGYGANLTQTNSSTMAGAVSGEVRLSIRKILISRCAFSSLLGSSKNLTATGFPSCFKSSAKSTAP